MSLEHLWFGRCSLEVMHEQAHVQWTYVVKMRWKKTCRWFPRPNDPKHRKWCFSSFFPTPVFSTLGAFVALKAIARQFGDALFTEPTICDVFKQQVFAPIMSSDLDSKSQCIALKVSSLIFERVLREKRVGWFSICSSQAWHVLSLEPLSLFEGCYDSSPRRTLSGPRFRRRFSVCWRTV